MIEPAMIFALGAMLATLAALLTLPLVSRLAQRRAVAAVARRMPVSAGEIAAERDQMRAAHALAVRALEQRIEALDGRLAATLGEGGRQVARLVALEESGARDRLALETTGQALAEARRTAEDQEAAAGPRAVALQEATALAERHGSALAAATARVTALEALLVDQRVLLDEAAKRSGPGAVSSRSGPSAAASQGPASDDLVQVRAANIRLRNEQEVLFASVAAATRERDRLRLQTDELLLRIEALQQAAAEATETVDADERLAARHARTVATLHRRIASRDEAITALKRRLAEAPSAAARELEPLPLFAVPAVGEARDAAALRQAVAQLAADIVRFATPTPRSLPPG